MDIIPFSRPHIDAAVIAEANDCLLATGWADATVFSFHSVKNITTGEGGGICLQLPDSFRLTRGIYLFEVLQRCDFSEVGRGGGSGFYKCVTSPKSLPANQILIMFMASIIQVRRKDFSEVLTCKKACNCLQIKYL